MTGMQWLRVFAACQALMAPTKFFRVTHKRAREVIKGELGFCPRGKPGTKVGRAGELGFRDGGEEAILEWLDIVALMHTRQSSSGVTSTDSTTVVFKAA